MKYLRLILSKLLHYVRLYWARVTIIILYLIFVWPDRYATHYSYIPKEEIYEALIEKTSTNISKDFNGKFGCEYSELIRENKYLYKKPYTETLIDGNDIRIGGEYIPLNCAPKFSTAIIVPYRNREKQLEHFLIYIHNFLRKQQIHYRIFVIEQYDQKPFNRAMLFNIGSVYASLHDFPCIILHDVDLMPMQLGNIYACSRRPRHMCASLDKFRYNLLYHGLFGGAVAIETRVFQFINGMSNMVRTFEIQMEFIIVFFLFVSNRNVKFFFVTPTFSSSMVGAEKMMISMND